MLKKLISISLVMLVILVSLITISLSFVSANRLIVKIDAFALDEYLKDWDKDNELHFQYEGLKISVYNKLTKIMIDIKELMGRDIEVVLVVPQQYIKSSVLSNIYIKNGTEPVMWQVKGNETFISFNLDAFEEVNMEIGKLSLAAGQTKKKIQSFWGYAEFNSYSDGSQKAVVTYITKSDLDYKVDNKHVIVQYRISSFGWYYPVGDVSSSNVYYYMDDLGDKYRLVTQFNTNESSHIKIHAFRGTEEGVLSYNSIKGVISKWWLTTTIGVKKILIDWFGNKTPSVS